VRTPSIRTESCSDPSCGSGGVATETTWTSSRQRGRTSRWAVTAVCVLSRGLLSRIKACRTGGDFRAHLHACLPARISANEKLVYRIKPTSRRKRFKAANWLLRGCWPRAARIYSSDRRQGRERRFPKRSEHCGELTESETGAHRRKYLPHPLFPNAAMTSVR